MLERKCSELKVQLEQNKVENTNTQNMLFHDQTTKLRELKQLILIRLFEQRISYDKLREV